MVTYRRLRDANFTTLGAAADHWNTLATRITPLANAARDRIVNPIRSGAWTGMASDNAVHELEGFMGDFTAAGIEAVTVASALRRAAAELSAAQSKVRDVDVRTRGAFFVDDVGTVHPPTLDEAAMHDPDAGPFLARKRGEADALQAVVDQALREAAEADALLSRTLERLRPQDIRGQLVGQPIQAALGDAEAVAQVPTDRALVPGWWRTLDPQMRAVLFAANRDELIKAGIMDPGTPWHPNDPGMGEHGAAGTGIKDRMFHLALQNAVIVADSAGLVNASRHLNHYLDNSGDPLDIDVDRMMRDVPEYASAVDGIVSTKTDVWKAQALEEFRRSGGAPVSIPVDSGWKGTYITQNQSQDWFLAIGGCETNVSGVVTVRPDEHGQPQVAMEYQVNVRDRYNWDGKQDEDGDGKPDTKSVTIGGQKFEDRQLGKLHEVGLAQEYDVRGNSDVATRIITNSPAAPTTPNIDDRDGTRSDADSDRADEHARW